MYAHVQDVELRPHFELEPSDSPLAREYHKGTTAQRVKEIMTEPRRKRMMYPTTLCRVLTSSGTQIHTTNSRPSGS
jgi:hypothetical protein